MIGRCGADDYRDAKFFKGGVLAKDLFSTSSLNIFARRLCPDGLLEIESCSTTSARDRGMERKLSCDSDGGWRGSQYAVWAKCSRNEGLASEGVQGNSQELHWDAVGGLQNFDRKENQVRGES